MYRDRLSGDARIKVYGPPAGVVENGYLNVVTVPGRAAEIAEKLKAAGIGVARTYPEPMDAQPPAKRAGAITHGSLEHSRSVCASVINLPLFHGIREDECDAAARALLAAL